MSALSRSGVGSLGCTNICLRVLFGLKVVLISSGARICLMASEVPLT